ncbi:Uncharacterised protein [Staphylococcus aureus]|nr:Uncharacterised protein [Staphylococcus aureus]SUK68829.1 Uncharacterised protein [Staphylococcus aureus]
MIANENTTIEIKISNGIINPNLLSINLII